MKRIWHCSNSLSWTCLWNYRVLTNRWKKVRQKSHHSREVKVHHMLILSTHHPWVNRNTKCNNILLGVVRLQIRHLEVEHYCRRKFPQIFDWSVGHNRYINFNIESCFFWAYYPNKVSKYCRKYFISGPIECNINVNLINSQNSTETIRVDVNNSWLRGFLCQLTHGWRVEIIGAGSTEFEFVHSRTFRHR